MATTTNPQEVDHLRDRVRLYLQVMLIIGFFSHVSDLVSPLIFDDYVPPQVSLSFTVIRWGITVLLAAAWSLVRFARPGRAALIAANV